MGLVDARQHGFQCGLVHLRIAAVALHLVAVALQFLQHVALQVGARSHIHDLEQRHQREVVVHRCVAWQQLAQAVEQVLQPQHGADAFIERVFVEHQGRGLS